MTFSGSERKRSGLEKSRGCETCDRNRATWGGKEVGGITEKNNALARSFSDGSFFVWIDKESFDAYNSSAVSSGTQTNHS